MQPHDAYKAALTALLRAQVRFACIGTYGLWLRHPEKLRDYPLRDCDVVVESGEMNLQNCLISLQDSGWSLKVWGEPLPEDWNMSFLSGKFYVRAAKENLVMDITFECPAITWKEFDAALSAEQGLPVASNHHIFLLKKLKSEELFLDFIQTWKFESRL